MTNEEARDYLNLMWVRTENPVACEAITLGEFALEKQIPKKPIKPMLNDEHCPTCNAWLNYEELWNGRCIVCGQALDWSEDATDE